MLKDIPESLRIMLHEEPRVGHLGEVTLVTGQSRAQQPATRLKHFPRVFLTCLLKTLMIGMCPLVDSTQNKDEWSREYRLQQLMEESVAPAGVVSGHTPGCTHFVWNPGRMGNLLEGKCC